jgi:hypothetical protein
MNDSKTEAMVFGTKSTVSKLKVNSIYVGDQEIKFQSSAKSLGFIFDSKLTSEDQAVSQCRNAYLHLRCLARIKKFLTPQCLVTLIHAFITSRLDYANSLYLGAPQYVIDRLQSVQNAAARLISNCRKSEHITPVLYNLHWLPVQQRIKFKVLLIIFKSRQGQCPKYISDLFSDYTPTRALRSADHNLLQVPFTRSSLVSDCSVSYAGPRLSAIH